MCEETVQVLRMFCNTDVRYNTFRARLVIVTVSLQF